MKGVGLMLGMRNLLIGCPSQCMTDIVMRESYENSECLLILQFRHKQLIRFAIRAIGVYTKMGLRGICERRLILEENFPLLSPC